MNHKILEQMVRNHRKNTEHTQQLWHNSLQQMAMTCYTSC